MTVLYDRPYMKSLLLRDKGFLLELYKNNSLQNKSQLEGADDARLDTIIRILFLVVNNEIPMFGDHYPLFKRARKEGFLRRHFQQRRTFLKVLEGTRQNKVSILQNFAPVYKFLFAPLFEEDEF